jgi:hypothetical protein
MGQRSPDRIRAHVSAGHHTTRGPYSAVDQCAPMPPKLTAWAEGRFDREISQIQAPALDDDGSTEATCDIAFEISFFLAGPMKNLITDQSL